MNAAAMTLADLSGALLGFILTIFVLSFVIGDNALFRLATHIFVGAAAGYVTVVTLYNVLWPQLLLPFVDGDREGMILALAFLVPSMLLLTKLSRRLSPLGNPAVAILVGIGAAAAVGGAIFGTVFPQTAATINTFDGNNLVNGVIVLVGTISTLLFFQFSTRSVEQDAGPLARFHKALGWLGKFFIAITFGALFAGVYITALTALIERFNYLWQFFKDLVLPTLG